jgi:large subunit ribosomal protein L24
VKTVSKNKLNVKKGDNVIAIAGKDKGKKGKVIQAIPAKERVIVEGINKVKKHSKPTQKMPQGGIIEMEAALHVSNVMIFCPKCDQGVRISKKILADGTKVRICSKCGETFDK